MIYPRGREGEQGGSEEEEKGAEWGARGEQGVGRGSKGEQGGWSGCEGEARRREWEQGGSEEGGGSGSEEGVGAHLVELFPGSDVSSLLQQLLEVLPQPARTEVRGHLRTDLDAKFYDQTRMASDIPYLVGSL